jgi:hypothetical protein
MNRAQGEERTQRIRIGLTGLAFVFLLVLLGTAISRSTEDPANPSTAENQLVGDDEPSEPLAEIGAAPSMPQGNEVKDAGPAKKP